MVFSIKLTYRYLLLIFHLSNFNILNQQTVYRQCLENASKATTTTQGIQNITTLAPPPGTECQRPTSFVSSDIFPNLWRVVYWTSQCLTW